MATKRIEDRYDVKAKKTYVYEVEAYYDPEIKNTRRKCKILGYRDPETGEIKPTRKRKPKVATHSSEENLLTLAKQIERQHYGATYYLHELAKQLHLIDDLQTVLPNHYQQVLNLAYYLILSPTNSMQFFSYWSKHQYLPYDCEQTLTSQRISELFQLIDEEIKQRFFNARMNRTINKEFLYYDTTSISSYSKTLSYAKYGYNKEDDKLPQINLAVVYGNETKLPLMYRYLLGDIPDSKTIPWLISLFDTIEKERIKLVMDRGFYSEKNVYQLIEENIGFIIGVKKNLKYVQAIMDQAKATIDNVEQYSTRYRLSGVRIQTDYFKTKSKKGHYPLQLYVYYDAEQASEQANEFNKKLQQYMHELEMNKEKEANKHQYATYFIKENQNGKIVYRYNNEAIKVKKGNFGYFVLMSSFKKDVWDILSLYRNKELIEDAFHNLKDRLNMRRMRVSSERGLEGKMFVQFIALILQAQLKQTLEQSSLNKEYTIQGFLSELNRVDILSIKGIGKTVGEVTVPLAELFEKTGVRTPG
ncbi:IS1634 family transposase [Tuanshanicoccus lijuaniae]|uniref:IS1634 family transposase n=1 Tax=Aerococcaceae bacterium zg-1292 TaxID=2774330 RepID=UPI001BD8B5D6|nr:IS1634 family transposase [Aerococcaceae bacterium zg-A91]MBS4457376.1 IS1634 family transposase [Aerococcaceae bacterium zg-BR33]